jgi:hypothetical protein
MNRIYRMRLADAPILSKEKPDRISTPPQAPLALSLSLPLSLSLIPPKTRAGVRVRARAGERGRADLDLY